MQKPKLSTQENGRFGAFAKGLKRAAVCLSLIGFLGLLSSGLCEDVVASSSSMPNLESGTVVPMEYKGGKRFVGVTTARVCKISQGIAAGGIGSGLLLAAVLYGFFRRLPHE